MKPDERIEQRISVAERYRLGDRLSRRERRVLDLYLRWRTLEELEHACPLNENVQKPSTQNGQQPAIPLSVVAESEPGLD